MTPLRIPIGALVASLVIAVPPLAAQVVPSYEAAALKQDQDQRDQQLQQAVMGADRRARAHWQWQALRQGEFLAGQEQRESAQARAQSHALQREALDRQAGHLRQSMAEAAARSQRVTLSSRQLRGTMQTQLAATLSEVDELASSAATAPAAAEMRGESPAAQQAPKSAVMDKSAGTSSSGRGTSAERFNGESGNPARAARDSEADASMETDGDAAELAASLLGGPGSPRCRDLERQIQQTLNRDKHLTGDGGKHGVRNRLQDQVTGKHGPGTKSWKNHEKAFRDAQSNLRDLLAEFATNHCGDPPRVAWELATRPAPKPSEWRGPQSTTFLGSRPHPLCVAGAGLVAIPVGMMGCVPEAGAAALVCSPAAEVPIVPVGCAVVGCGHGAVLAGGAAFTAFERACSRFMAQ